MTVIVSAYYKIPSKQSHGFYGEHLRRFFGALRTQHVVFFTTPDVEAEIRKWGVGDNVTFVNLEFAELSGWKKGNEFWNRQKLLDPEPYHSPELAVVWYEKRHFVRRAMEMDKFSDEDVFTWCDAGCIRDDKSASAAVNFGLRNIIDLTDNKIHLPQITEAPAKQYYKYPYIKFACGFLAGTRTAWNEYVDKYEEMLDEYDTAGISGNSDQYITASCIDRYPTLFVPHLHSNYPPTGNPWFFILHVL
jgi:hypothetical protein